jgi:hypothetical protein
LGTTAEISLDKVCNRFAKEDISAAVEVTIAGILQLSQTRSFSRMARATRVPPRRRFVCYARFWKDEYRSLAFALEISF